MPLHLAFAAFYFSDTGPDQTVWHVQVRKLVVDGDSETAAKSAAEIAAQDILRSDEGGWTVDGRPVTMRLGMVAAQAVDPSTLRPEGLAALGHVAEEHTIIGAQAFAAWLAEGEVYPLTPGVVTPIARAMISVPARVDAVMAAAHARPVVNLWKLIGVGLIVLDSAGIPYSNQVDGHSCRQAEAVGHLIPLNRPGCGWGLGELERDLAHAFAGGWQTFSPMVCRECQRILDSHPETRGLEVVMDSTRSYEAWVHVRIGPDAPAALADFRGCSGVVTWNNSD
jgi:hypothetical protein